jgi:hypothetical protein
MKVKTLIGCFLPLLLLGAGFFFDLIAGVWLWHTQRFVQSAEHAKGVVVEVVTSLSDSGTTLSSPVVEFTDHLGRQQKFQSSSASHPQRFFVDDEVQILYDRNNPRSAIIDDWFELYFGHIICFFIGTSEIFFSILLFIFGYFCIRDDKKNVPSTNTTALCG